MKKFNPAEGTRFQRLLTLTLSGGAKARAPRNKRRSKIVDTLTAVAFVILILFIWVALP